MRHWPRIYDYMMVDRIGTRPITAFDVAEHLKIDTDLITGEFKTYIEGLIDAAVLFGEAFTKRTFIDSNFVAYLDGFVGGASYEIRKSPVNSITSITYTTGGTQTVFSSSSYYLASSPTFARLGLVVGYSWPYSDSIMHAVEVAFVAGYTSAAFPADLREALLQHVGAMYANRGDCSPSSSDGSVSQCSMPASVKNIYSMRKIRDIGIGM